MLSAEVRRRISALNRKPRLDAGMSTRPILARAAAHELPAGIEQQTAAGACWRIERPVDQLWPDAARFLNEDSLAASCVPELDSSKNKIQRELVALHQSLPDQVVFLDLETCGFAGSMVFLVGLMTVDQGRWKLVQLLARNYAEERAMLQAFWQLAAGKEVLATFNGKSFDWPQVHDRSTLHQLGRPPERLAREDPEDPERGEPFAGSELLTAAMVRPRLWHCDLLHHCRRAWKHRLSDCKLQTLEFHLCGRRRVEDIPGKDIPQAYHDFVRSGDAWPIRSILHHNALDLLTLLQLSLRLLGVRRWRSAG